MRRIFGCLCVFLLPLTAFADGKVLPAAVAENLDVTIPDQRALIHFTNGIERLVIETRFVGSGSNFAWVIPLPAKPEIEEASAGLFPTLEYLFRPRVIHYVPAYYAGLFALLVLGYFVAVVRPTGRISWLDVAVCILSGIAAGLQVPTEQGFFILGGFTFCVLLLFAGLIRHGRPELAAVAASVLMFFVIPLAAPATARSKAGGSTSASDAVDVLERNRVGVFDTTTIASSDPEALEGWLRKNGFAIPTNSRPVVADYVKDGWVFVAAKVNRSAANRETSTPHPLSFTFKTETPVYPMRLTGVDSGPVKVELYVFGSSRAKARNFDVVRCARPEYPKQPEYWQRWKPEAPVILHPLLRRWVDGAPVVTKLSAELSPAQMRTDVWLGWTPYFSKQPRLYSRQGALKNALNWSTGSFAVFLCVTSFISWRPGQRERWLGLLARSATAGCCFGIALTGILYFCTSKTEIRLVRSPVLETQNNLYHAMSYFDVYDPADTAVRARFGKGTNDANTENLILGGRIREEDSPGNFTLQDASNRVEFITYDAQGARHVLKSWIKASR